MRSSGGSTESQTDPVNNKPIIALAEDRQTFDTRKVKAGTVVTRRLAISGGPEANVTPVYARVAGDRAAEEAERGRHRYDVGDAASSFIFGDSLSLFLSSKITTEAAPARRGMPALL